MRRRLPVLLIAMMAALAAVVAVPLAASAKPGMQVGVEQFGNMDNPAYTPLLLDTQKDVGAQLIRYLLRFDWVAKCDATAGGGAPATSPANTCYDWTVPDRVVRGADDRGMRVLLSVYGTPKWLFNRGENWMGQTDADFGRLVTRYAAFTQAAATRYSGRSGLPRVNQWTIWNEANGSFMEPRFINGVFVGPARYARLYDAASRAIKSVDATLQVAVGPTAPHASKGPPITWAKQVLPALQRLGSPVDAWAHNAYMGGQSPLNHTIKPPFVGLGNVADLTSLMDGYSVTAGKPLWITEFGYLTGGKQKAVDEPTQALLAADALVFAWSQPRIDTFIWYGLHDDIDPDGFNSGLYRPIQQLCEGQLCPKPVAGVFRHTLWVSARKNGQVTLWGQARNVPASTRIYVKVPGDGWRAYSNPETERNGTVSIRVKAPSGTQVMTCDVRCGPMRTIGTIADGGGTDGRTPITKLTQVKLPKRPAVRYGVTYNVPGCTKDCRVYGRIIAKGASSGIARAKKSGRSVVIGKSKARNTAGGKRVTMKFSVASRRELLRRKQSTVILRTWIRYADGRKVITDRPVLLR